jgi:hypothetical protein
VQQRVACQGRPGAPCGAHRDLALSARCFVCGSVDWRPVAPSVGDCYTALDHWTSTLVTLDPSAVHLALLQAFHQAASQHDVEAGRVRP